MAKNGAAVYHGEHEQNRGGLGTRLAKMYMSQQHGTKYNTTNASYSVGIYHCLTSLILLTEVQSVKYPAEGLCHSSIAQEEANARVLE